MKIELLHLLRCPETGQKLIIQSKDSGNINSGFLITEDGLKRYPIVRGVPRFVTQSNYTDNFGMQWNRFSKTQLDSFSGIPISANRFWLATNWTPDSLKDQWVLDAGCGAGRFAEIALKAGAKVVALDYSNAVDACYANLRHFPNFHILQGDIYKLPLYPNAFNYVYSLGVLQHTPDVHKAFIALTKMTCKDGKLCVDYYWKRFRTMFHSKYLFRPFTKRMNNHRLFKILERITPKMLTISQILGSIPYIGILLKRAMPVADYTNIFQLSQTQLEEWALLDTFDMLAPKYDNPQKKEVVYKWFEEAGFTSIEVGHHGHLVARGVNAKIN